MILTATGLLWEALGKPAYVGAVPDPHPCAGCGRAGGEIPSVNSDDYLPVTFNDRDLLSAGTGRLCIACVSYYERAKRGVTLRSSHLIVSASNLERADTVRMFALCSGEGIPNEPFAAVVALSYKKHLLPRARVAVGSRTRFPVSLELESGVCEVGRFRDIASRVRRLRDAGLWAEDIERWAPVTHRLVPCLSLWVEESRALTPLRGSFLFRLALRLVTLPPKEKPCPKTSPKRQSVTTRSR